MALRKMIQAHGLVDDALLKEGQAKKVYKLAQSLNSSIPAYMNAAQQAAIHVLATFSGLQVDMQSKKKKIPFATKTKERLSKDASETDLVVHNSEVAMTRAD